MSGSGQYMEVRIKKNAGAYGALAGATSAKLFTRAALSLDLDKATYKSARIRPSQQTADSRHGTRRSNGSLKDELACAAFGDLFAAVLRTAWAAGPTTGAVTTIAANATAPHFVRSSGSFISDGFRVGHNVRPSGFATTGAANNGKNFVITALTATDMSVGEVGQETTTVAAKAAGDTVTIAATGKTLIVPQSAHTRDDFNIERLYKDFSPNRSELFTGVVPTGFTIEVKPDGMVTVEFPFIGKDRIDSNSGEYFTTPTGVNTNMTFGSAIGYLHLYGSIALYITGLTLTVTGNHQPGNPILVPSINEVFPGRVEVSGTLSGYLANFALRDAFKQETEGNLIFFLAESAAAAANAFGVVIPRCKVGKVDLQDGETMFVQNIPFEGLENLAGTGVDLTTIRLQDTTL